MPKGENNSYRWRLDKFKSCEKLPEDFIESTFFTSVSHISKTLECPRMTFYYYLKHKNKSSEKLRCYNIIKINIKKEITVKFHNPEIEKFNNLTYMELDSIN